MKYVTIPAGITWKRTGRRTWLCTIRREPEAKWEWEPADFAALNQAAISNTAFANYPELGQLGGVGAVFGGLGL